MSALIGIGILIIASVALITYSFISTRANQRATISRRLQGVTGEEERAQKNSENAATAKWFKEKAAPILAKPVKPKSASEQSNLKIKLANAGIRKESAPVTFLASKTICAASLFILTMVTSIGAGYQSQKIFGIVAFATGLGFMLPEIWIYLAKKSRQEKITHGLPDCLDLMVVSVEAGLGIDAALMRVSGEMSKVHPEMAEEFKLVNMEIQMGLTRAEALTNLAIRTGVQDLKSLAAMLIQAEKFGTSIAKALRTHGDSLRVKRRQQAEERAAKTSVKLTLPLILFIFPAIFVVLAGPAVLKLWDVMTSGILTGG